MDTVFCSETGKNMDVKMTNNNAAKIIFFFTQV